MCDGKITAQSQIHMRKRRVKITKQFTFTVGVIFRQILLYIFPFSISVGIVVGVVVALSAIAGLAYYMKKR